MWASVDPEYVRTVGLGVVGSVTEWAPTSIVPDEFEGSGVIGVAQTPGDASTHGYSPCWTRSRGTCRTGVLVPTLTSGC